MCGPMGSCDPKSERTSASQRHFDVDKLTCYGCCHSASSIEYPSRPSGERSCCFCIRNKDIKTPPEVDSWYDGTKPIYLPMDCYHSLDIFEQLVHRYNISELLKSIECSPDLCASRYDTDTEMVLRVYKKDDPEVQWDIRMKK